MNGTGWWVVATAMLMLPSGATAQAKGAEVIGDAASWFSSDSYPKAAIYARAEGRVIVTLLIDGTGGITGCTVKVSSGNAALDQGTCDAARAKARFSPATDMRGKPISGTYDLSVRWVLPNVSQPMDVAALPLRMEAVTEVSVGRDGVLTGCRVLASTGFPEGVDLCEQAKVGNREQVMARNGRPISYKLIRRITLETVPGE